MKLADKLLIVATILSIGWALILAARVPLQLCAAIAPDLGSEFQEVHDEAEARRLTAEVCMVVGETVRDVVLLSAAPAMVTGFLWGLLAVVRWYRGVIPAPVKDDRRRPRP